MWLAMFSCCGGLVNASNPFPKTNTLIGDSSCNGGLPDICIRGNYPFGMVQFYPDLFHTKQLGFVINQLSGCGMRSYGKFPYASGCRSFTGFSG